MHKIRKLIALLKYPPYFKIFLRYGVAAGVEHESVLKALDFRTVVDIGANRGQFALVVRRILPTAAIYSFEPLPIPARRFKDIFFGQQNVVLYQSALGADDREVTMHISARDDSSSLLAITDAQSTLFPGTEEAAVTTVRVRPLCTFIGKEKITHPALLKLDVQGFEFEVLKGCEDMLDAFSHVYAECSFIELYKGQPLVPEIISWLHARQFTLRGIYNLCYDKKGQAIQADFLFCRE